MNEDPDGPIREWTSAERAAAIGRDPDGFFARLTVESHAAAVAEVNARDAYRARAARAEFMRRTGLQAIATVLARVFRRRRGPASCLHDARPRLPRPPR